MNSILNRKKVTTIIFMVCLIIYSGINIMKGEFVGRYAFMEGYGLYQNILGKNEYNNFSSDALPVCNVLSLFEPSIFLVTPILYTELSESFIKYTYPLIKSIIT